MAGMFDCPVDGSDTGVAVRQEVEPLAAVPGPALWEMQGEAACRAGDPPHQSEEPPPEGLGGPPAHPDRCAPSSEWADVVRVAATDTGRKADKPAPTLSEVADRTERRNPRIVPDPSQRRRPKGETETDDEEWPRSDDDTETLERARGRLKRAVQKIDLPPKKAAAVLDSIIFPAPKRRQSPYGGKVAMAQPPAKAGKRKGDADKVTTARKPVLVLGR